MIRTGLAAGHHVLWHVLHKGVLLMLVECPWLLSHVVVKGWIASMCGAVLVVVRLSCLCGRRGRW